MSAPDPFTPPVRLTVAKALRSRAQARAIIKDHVIGAMSAGMLPLPLIDGLLLTNIQWNLICRLADHYGVALKRIHRTMATSLIGGSLPVLFSGAGSGLLKLVPGLGPVAGGVALCCLAGAFTQATGKVFMDHFESGGTMDDYCPDAFRRQLRFELAGGSGRRARLGAGLRT